MAITKLINGVYVKGGVYFTTGGLYQSTLSNQNYIDIKKIIKTTQKRFVSVSTKIRNTCCFTTKEELEEICKVDKKVNLKDIEKNNSEYLADIEDIMPIKTLPIVCPLGLYIIENYPPIQRKKENCIIAMKLGDKNKNGIIEPIYAAITIFNDSLYFCDKNGEFVGSEADLLVYIKKIKSKIILNSIHSTEECFEKIENTFFTESFQFKRIGVDVKNKDSFKYNSSDIFFSKKALSNAEKIIFYDFNKKEEKIKKLAIFSSISIIVLGAIGFIGYSYYEQYKEEKEAEEAARIEAMKPKVIPSLNFNTIDYFNKYCFKDLDLFYQTSKTWALKSIKCNTKDVSYTLSNSVDLGNYLTNKNDFYITYQIESKNFSKYTFDPSGKNAVFKPSVKFEGIKEDKVFKFNEQETRKYIATLTENNQDDDYQIKTLINQNKLKSWEITSSYSPMYLQEKYHLFNKLYINSIELNVDNNSGIFNWKITGIFN